MSIQVVLLLIVGILALGLVVRIGMRGARVPLPPAPPPLSPLGEQVRAGYDLTEHWVNLEEVIARLQGVFPSSVFKQPPVSFPPFSDGDQVAYLKALVRGAANRYGLNLHKLAVRFTRHIPDNECGRIRQDGATVYVDFAEKYRDNDTALIAIVAHEIAHLALWSRQLGRPGTPQAEELADALAVLAGYGPVTLAAAYLELIAWGPGASYHGTIFQIGYLHPRALGYLTIRQAQMAGVADLAGFSRQCGPWAQDAHAFIAGHLAQQAP